MIILCIMMNQRPYLWLQTGARRKTNVSTFHTGGNCMTTQIAIVLGIIALMSISFFFELLPLGFTALMVPVLLQGTGILDAKTAWSGLSNITVITWIGLFIIGAVFAKTSFTYRIRVFKLSTTTSSGGLILALQRAITTACPEGRYRKHCYWLRYKAVLLESSLLESSACSLIYFCTASSVILPIVST